MKELIAFLLIALLISILIATDIFWFIDSGIFTLFIFVVVLLIMVIYSNNIVKKNKNETQTRQDRINDYYVLKEFYNYLYFDRIHDRPITINECMEDMFKEIKIHKYNEYITFIGRRLKVLQQIENKLELSDGGDTPIQSIPIELIARWRDNTEIRYEEEKRYNE